ncbi:MAG: VanW family protein [Candidatus Microgenomates bacterium]
MLIRTSAKPQVQGSSSVVLASHSFSLEDRYSNTFVNDVFKDNILLALAYMDGSIKDKADISWNQVESPFNYEFTLEPGQEFAFHDSTLPDYSENVVKTTNAHFMWDEGFKSDGDLTGDGVCHLASLIYWTAKDAGLNAYAPSNHNFAVIPDVPKEYGVAIMSPSPLGNLYIIDSLEKPVSFIFNYDGTNLSVSAVEQS